MLDSDNPFIQKTDELFQCGQFCAVFINPCIFHTGLFVLQEENVDGDPELLDDSEFYQQLLKEFFESCDLASSEATFYALRKLQPKKRKVVDRRASKSRKIRMSFREL